MNKKKINEIELELSNIKLKKENKVIKKDSILDVNENKEFKIIIENDLTLVIYIKSENYCKINLEVKENISLNLIQFISNKESSLEFNTKLNKNSKLNTSQIIFNNRYLKNNISLHENSYSNLKGAFLNSNSNSIILNSSFQLEKNSISNITIKGAAQNNSTVSNDGIIKISKNGFNCIGHQNLKNIILDQSSKINSEPILEIHNNEVKCSHGCSISQIEDEIINYIKSRGITQSQATKLIIEGFFYDTIENLSYKKEEIIENIEKKFQKNQI